MDVDRYGRPMKVWSEDSLVKRAVFGLIVTARNIVVSYYKMLG